jgi:hypothetical protein
MVFIMLLPSMLIEAPGSIDSATQRKMNLQHQSSPMQQQQQQQQDGALLLLFSGPAQ